MGDLLCPDDAESGALPSTPTSCFGIQTVYVYVCIVNHGVFTFPTLPHHTLARAGALPSSHALSHIATYALTQDAFSSTVHQYTVYTFPPPFLQSHVSCCPKAPPPSCMHGMHR